MTSTVRNLLNPPPPCGSGSLFDGFRARFAVTLTLLAVSGGLGSCAEGAGEFSSSERSAPSAPSAAETALAQPVLQMVPEVIAEYPHDQDSYTQGLVWHDGFVFESTGQYGNSSVRKWRLGEETSAVQVDLSDDLFGEGLEEVNGELVQLTWKAGKAYRYSLDSLGGLSEQSYSGEGWGLAFDGTVLYMSDGTHVIRLRDPISLETTGRFAVRKRGSPVDRLNELEFVDGDLYANVYQTDRIVRFNREGVVTAEIDAAGLLTPEEASGAEVLNGIAYRPETETFLITGKNWPKIFEVRFRPVD